MLCFRKKETSLEIVKTFFLALRSLHVLRMIAKMSEFKEKEDLPDGFLTVLEQMPGPAPDGLTDWCVAVPPDF